MFTSVGGCSNLNLSEEHEMVVRNMLSLDCYTNNNNNGGDSALGSANAFSMRLWRLAHVWTAYRSEYSFLKLWHGTQIKSW